MFAAICVGLCCLISDFYPAYSSIKTYREATNDENLKFWQKYWSVRSVFLLVDYIIWPYIEDFSIFYLAKIGIYVWLSSFGLATMVFDSVISPLYSEVEPYLDIIIQHTELIHYFSSWRGAIYKFFIEDLEEFLVPN